MDMEALKAELRRVFGDAYTVQQASLWPVREILYVSKDDSGYIGQVEQRGDVLHALIDAHTAISKDIALGEVAETAQHIKAFMLREEVQ